VIDALPLMLKEMPNLVYLIVGDDPERKRLQQSIVRLGFAAHMAAGGACIGAPEFSGPDLRSPGAGDLAEAVRGGSTGMSAGNGEVCL
jgi:hypothetical protein